MNLFRLLHYHATEYPDRPAVKTGRRRTYKELDHMSDYVLQKLTENESEERLRVFYCGREQKGYAVAYISVMKAGGAYIYWISYRRAELSTC